MKRAFTVWIFLAAAVLAGGCASRGPVMLQDGSTLVSMGQLNLATLSVLHDSGLYLHKYRSWGDPIHAPILHDNIWAHPYDKDTHNCVHMAALYTAALRDAFYRIGVDRPVIRNHDRDGHRQVAVDTADGVVVIEPAWGIW